MSQPIARNAQPMRRRPAEAARVPPTTAGVDINLTATAPPGETALPHERDQKGGMTDGIPSPRVQQGARDVKRGVLDTSRALEADSAYRKLKQ